MTERDGLRLYAAANPRVVTPMRRRRRVWRAPRWMRDGAVLLAVVVTVIDLFLAFALLAPGFGR